MLNISAGKIILLIHMNKEIRRLRIYKVSVLLILLFAIFVGCSNKKAIKEKIKEMQSMPVIVPFSQMMYINKIDSVKYDFSIDSFPFRMIVFSGSDECSSCTLSRLFEWNTLLNYEKKKKMQLYFIINPPKNELDNVIKSYRSSGLEHSIFIDTCGIFLEKNPNIPTERLYHTFLLDSSWNVVLVGNPLDNAKIKEIFDQTIRL